MRPRAYRETQEAMTASELTWGAAVKLAALVLLHQTLYMIH
jgi:hypothetical protein